MDNPEVDGLPTTAEFRRHSVATKLRTRHREIDRKGGTEVAPGGSSRRATHLQFAVSLDQRLSIVIDDRYHDAMLLVGLRPRDEDTYCDPEVHRRLLPLGRRRPVELVETCPREVKQTVRALGVVRHPSQTRRWPAGAARHCR